MSLNSSFSEDVGYVNIHGQDVKVLVCEKTGRILIPIDEVKNMGFRIYRKSQYSRLIIDPNQFNKEFHLFMLQSAQNYMLENKIMFKENEIIESINKCKEILAGNTYGLSVSNGSTKCLPITQQNLKVHNKETGEKTKLKFSDKSSCSDSSLKNESFVENKPQIHQFTPQNTSPNKSFGRPSFNSVSPEDRKTPNQLRLPHNTVKTEEKGYKKLESITLNKPEHTVLVSHTDHKVVWVQDTENADILLEIDNKIKKEVLKQPNINTTKLSFNKIYLAPYDGSWFRAKIVKFNPLSLFFVDYGNIENVDVLKDASEELSQIPAQAVKIGSSSQASLSLYDVIKLRVKNRNENGSYYVDIIPETTKGPAVKPETTTGPAVKQETTKGPAVFFTKPKPLCKLEQGQRVMIVGEFEGKLALRTKECCDKLKIIETAIESVNLKSVEEVDKEQQVLCSYKDKIWRGNVTNIQGNRVEVELLDYYEKTNLPLSSINHTTESLAGEPTTFILTPEVKGFSPAAKQLIEELINVRAKSTVVLNGDNFDLQLDTGLLSELIAPKPIKKNVVRLQDLQKYKPKLGVGEYMLQIQNDPEKATICDVEAIQEHLAFILKAEIEEPGPYEPIMGEICFGLYQDSWSRCEVQRIMKDQFEVKFIDFGNVETLKPGELAKLSLGAKDVPVLGIPCRLVGLPKGKNIESALSVGDGETFEVDVKRFDGRLYDVEIPTLYAQLQ